MLVLFGASIGSAQVIVRGSGSPGYLGIRFEEIVTRGDGANSDRIVVREVSKNSPAEKAGIKVEDEIVRINGLVTTNGKFGAIARTLVEGDTVRLRVKREGKERDFTIVAAERPNHLGMFHREIIIAPDSLRKLTLRYLDSARVHLDSLRLPNIYISTDSARGGRRMFRYSLPSDSLFMKRDSVVMRMFRARPGEPLLPIPPGELIEFDRELGPGMIFKSIELGARAIGGAELTEMDPGVAAYFGTDGGLLALRVLPETPADRAGLQPGDVVVKAKDRTVRSVAELRSIIAANPDGVKLEIRRKGQTRTLELKTRSR
jgi:membrane-associated protease RseP (regulator of RpoE activity)